MATLFFRIGAPMSAVPYRSRLWSAAGADGSRLVTWENFALNRDTNTPVNAQIEFRASGDFVTRSNEVETVCRRVDPEDWDGDGWRNEDDPDPYAWDEYWDSFWQELPDGANESAYCWIEIRPRWHSYIEFVGDGPSDLDDPYLWAKAGETYRVRLLIGKTYTIVSSQPLEVVGRSSPLIVIDGNGTREIEVVWPVTFSALEGNGSSFMMRVVPSGLGGTFSWTQHCCGLTGYGNQFWWAHERSCCCGGCSASGVYSYEGYEKDCIGGHCCCPRYDDDDPYAPQGDDGPYAAGASAGFSKAVVIFEDAYTNMPGEVVARRSTQTTLACIAHGGESGGTATFSIENGAKLVSRSGGSLPVTRFVPPKQKIEFEIVYEGRLPSDSEGDIKAKADFTERGTGTRHSTRTDRMTAVKVLISPEELPPENSSPNRHLLGVQEKVYYHLWPETVEVALSDGDRGRDIFIDDYEQCFYCPWTGGVYAVSVECASQNYDIPLTVIEPGVECIGARWNESLDANAVEDSSGWVGMVLLLYLTPRTVAFQRISMVEIPVLESEAHELAPDDYFALMPDVLTKTHDSRAGAGRWKMPQLIGNGYYWTGDFAQMPRECPPLTNCLERVWAQGLMRWDIPVGWGEPNVVRGSMRQNPTEQVYEIEPDGTQTIRKYQHWIKRDISGRVWLDGSRVNAWWSDLW